MASEIIKMQSKIEIFPTKDRKIIEPIIFDPLIWRESSDDSCPENPDRFDASGILDNFLFLCVSVNSVYCGLFMFEIKTPIVYFVHTLMTSKCRGSLAIKAGKKAINWIFENTCCKKIQSYCFSDSPATLLFARLCGFKVLDRTAHSCLRKGKKVDIINCFLDNPLIQI